MLHDKLDTIVSDNEIKRYYDSFSANFVLDEYAVQSLFIQVPAEGAHLSKVKTLYTSDREEDVRALTEYCATNAITFENFNEDWVLWQDVLKKLPDREETGRLFSNNRIEFREGTVVYLARIKEKKAPGDVAPLVLVREKIRNIILNKRKVEFINNLEKNMYQDALSKNQFKIYF
jgi:hypothetical protein